MIRSLAMIVIGLLLLIQPAQAGSDTYCVGGFQFVGGYSSRQACAQYRNIHRRWHFHVYVQGPDGLCRECWDEEDNTCDTTFLRQHPDFHTISRYACQRANIDDFTWHDLRPLFHPSEYTKCLYPGVLPDALKHFRDLDGQFAGGHHYDTFDAVGPGRFFATCF